MELKLTSKDTCSIRTKKYSLKRNLYGIGLLFCHKSNIHTMSKGPFTACRVLGYGAKKRGHKRKSYEMQESRTRGSSAPCTKSATQSLTKVRCFFCQKDDDQKNLFRARTEDAGKALRRSVEIAQDPVLMTKLNNAISPSDAHAIDVRYHKICWTRHVLHVLRNDAGNQAKPTQTDLPCKYLV